MDYTNETIETLPATNAYFYRTIFEISSSMCPARTKAFKISYWSYVNEIPFFPGSIFSFFS